MNLTVGASIQFGIPVPMQLIFIVDSAMDKLTEPGGVDQVRRLLGALDRIECQLLEATELLQARRVGDLEPNLGVTDALEKEYDRWSGRLSDTLGAPRYQFAKRFHGVPPGGAGSVPVRG